MCYVQAKHKHSVETPQRAGSAGEQNSAFFFLFFFLGFFSFSYCNDSLICMAPHASRTQL